MSDALEGLSLVGGRPALDFTNTEGGVRNGPPERLGSYGDLAAWAAFAGVVGDEEAEALAAGAARRPEEADRVLARALELREALYRIFAETSSGAPSSAPAAADRAVLDRELAEALGRRRLVPVEGAGSSFEWRFEGAEEGERVLLDAPLWRIVLDAADLLTSDRLERVKECGGEECTWLFLDESRNRSRRWCDMGDCGNRAKARRYRERHGREG